MAPQFLIINFYHNAGRNFARRIRNKSVIPIIFYDIHNAVFVMADSDKSPAVMEVIRVDGAVFDFNFPDNFADKVAHPVRGFYLVIYVDRASAVFDIAEKSSAKTADNIGTLTLVDDVKSSGGFAIGKGRRNVSRKSTAGIACGDDCVGRTVFDHCGNGCNSAGVIAGNISAKTAHILDALDSTFKAAVFNLCSAADSSGKTSGVRRIRVYNAAGNRKVMNIRKRSDDSEKSCALGIIDVFRIVHADAGNGVSRAVEFTVESIAGAGIC